MTQRIRELLDGAVADLEPEIRDPVAVVVRRGRAARRTRVMAGALAVVLLLAGGSLINRQVAGDDRWPSAESAVERPPVPHVVGDAVVAGAMELPIPAGWRVVTADADQPCQDFDKTILMITSDRRGCQHAPVEVVGNSERGPAGMALRLPKNGSIEDAIVSSPVSITLRGGEPAWLSNGFETLRPSKEPLPNFNILVLPWSMIRIFLRGDGPSQKAIVASIRSKPTEFGALALPETAAMARLTTPDLSGENGEAGHRKSTDPATIAAVLGLLRTRTTVVDDAEACANDKQHNALLRLDHGIPAPRETTTVVIALSPGCQEAVSSDGGRVRLSDATVTELKRLFGIEAR